MRKLLAIFTIEFTCEKHIRIGQVFDPLQIPFLDDVKYFVIDNKSRHIYIAFLESRSKILFVFKKYQLRVERE